MQPEQVEPDVERGFRIHATLAPKINPAFHQNAVPVLPELAVANNTERQLEQVKLAFFSEPAFFRPKT